MYNFANVHKTAKKGRPEHYDRQIDAVAKLIGEADAVLVGGGSGLSSAAGYNHYRSTPAFRKQFALFRETYGFDSLFDGFYFLYSSFEEQWGYYSQYIKFLHDAAPGRTYQDLYEILKKKPYFILTTNIDMQFGKVFPHDRICMFQGDFSYFQCSQPCHDALYPNKVLVEEMDKSLKGTCIPTSLVPRCAHCGRIMVPWVRDDTFLEGKFWLESVERYRAFLQQSKEARIVFLELGVGDMTPNIIKLPFWKMVGERANASLISINMGKSSPPEQLKNKALALDTDIATSLADVKARLCT